MGWVFTNCEWVVVMVYINEFGLRVGIYLRDCVDGFMGWVFIDLRVGSWVCIYGLC
jgi:hypothetical protein